MALVIWNMRRRHSSHSCQPVAAEPSVKAVRSPPRSGRSAAESLYGRRSEGYTRASALGCRVPPFHLSPCAFKRFPDRAAAGYSGSNREESILRSTTVFVAGSRSGNLQQPCSNPRGVTCPYPADAVGGVLFALGVPLTFTDVNAASRPPGDGLR